MNQVKNESIHGNVHKIFITEVLQNNIYILLFKLQNSRSVKTGKGGKGFPLKTDPTGTAERICTSRAEMATNVCVYFTAAKRCFQPRLCEGLLQNI